LHILIKVYITKEIFFEGRKKATKSTYLRKPFVIFINKNSPV
jgi:hypothetical protein